MNSSKDEAVRSAIDAVCARAEELRAPVATVQIIASKEVETAALKAFEAAAAYCQEVRKAGKWVNSFDFLERWVAFTESANEEVAG